MQGWESVRWLVIEITFLENGKVGSFYHKIDSCFLIETKFISKLFKKFRRQNESQEIPRLRLFIILSYYHILKSKNQKNQKTRRFKKKLEVRYTGLPEILRFSDSQISQIHIFQGCSQIFLYFWSKFMTNTGFKGPLRVQKISKFSKFQNPSKKYWNRSGIDN